MTKKTLQLSLLSLLAVVSMSFGLMAWAQTWQGPPAGDPPACDGSKDGCFSPINVSDRSQTKIGILTLINGIFLKGTSMVESDINFIGNQKFLRFSATTTEISQKYNDGKIGRLTGSNTALDNRRVLDLIGVRQNAGDINPNPNVRDRLVRIWDNLIVSGTTTTGNLYANNYFICSGAGNCSPFTGGSDSWAKVIGSTPGSIYYDKGVGGNVGIGNNAPAALLDLGSNAYAGPAYLRLNSASGRTAGVRWADSGTDIWYLYKSNVAGSGTKKDLILADGPNVADTKVTFSNGSFAMTVKGGLRANSLQGDVLVVNNANSVEPTNTGIRLGNSGVTGDYVLYVKGTPANPSTGDVYLKPISEIAGVSSDVWAKSGTKVYPKTVSDYVGIGTSAPTGILHVVNNNKTALRVGTGGDFQTNDAPGSAWNNFGSVDANYPVANFFNSIKGVVLSISQTGFGMFTDGIGAKGNSIFEGQVQINANTVNNSLKIGTGLANDGKIGYKLNTAGPSNNLDIIGVSQNGSGASGDRRVKIWDNLTVAGISTTTDLVVLGTTTTRNLYVSNNIFAQNLCTKNGSCVSLSSIVNNLAGFWTKLSGQDEIVYSGRIGVAGATDPNSSVDLAIGNNSIGLQTATSPGPTNPFNLSLVTNGVKRLILSNSGEVSVQKSLVATNVIAAPVQTGDTTGWLNRDQYVYDIMNNDSGTIAAKKFCLGGYQTTGPNCITAWPEAGAGAPVLTSRILCSFNSSGVASGGCGNASIDDGSHKNYILTCPSGYRVVSGGGWCDAGGGYVDMLRENRPDGGSSWKVSCVRYATVAGPVRNVPIGGATLICER